MIKTVSSLIEKKYKLNMRRFSLAFNPKSEFAKNVLTIMTGSAIAQMLPLIVAPILTRIYSPSDYGVLALFMAVCSVFSIVSTGQYEASIILPEKDSDAINLAALSLFICGCLSFSLVMAVWIFNKEISTSLGNEKISMWLYFIPLTVFFTGLYNVLYYWASRKKKFTRIATRTVLQAVINSFVKLGMGIKGFTGGGLIVGTIAGQVTASGFLAVSFWKENKTNFKLINRIDIKSNAKRYQNFPKFSLVQSFLDSINVSCIVFLITTFFNSAVLGIYSFANGILQKPLSLLGSSITQVFYQKATETYNKGESVWPITKKIILRLLIVAVPFFSIVLLWGPELFGFVFGEKWKIAGVYAQLLTPWLFVNFISSPISPLPLVLNKQRPFFFISLALNLSAPVIFFSSAVLTGNIYQCLFLLSLFNAVYLFCAILWVRRISNMQ